MTKFIQRLNNSHGDIMESYRKMTVKDEVERMQAEGVLDNN
jgi:hypothetical protein